MTSRLPVLLLLILAAAQWAVAPSATAAETNLNTWGDDYTKVATGGRDDVQYNLYRKKGDDAHVFIELVNRKDADVKVDLRLVAGHGGEDGPVLTGYVKAKGFWPNGTERRIAYGVKDPEATIRAVTVGRVDEEEVLETADDGTQVTRYKYRFTSLDELKRAKQNKD